jgi:hypothetical protein
MCTLTFIAGDTSHRIAMNRDERIARGAGQPPEIHEVDGTKAIYPGDGEGGTWIGVNELGIVLALLNWTDAADKSGGKTRSRGQVIPALIASHSLAELCTALQVSSLKGMLPFRLVGVFAFEKEIREWRWDSTQIDSQVHRWDTRHWFSSSLSDQKAGTLRGAACRHALSEADAGSAAWLRRLHASHAGGPGPFSMCVHREDVQTLSYTEIHLAPATVAVEHFLGSPCGMRAGQSNEMQRAVSMRMNDPHSLLIGHAGI